MEIKKVAQELAGAKYPLVLTGAGVSAESGIPTFRGADGYWKRFRPEELASPDAFRRDPRLVWEWYNERRLAIVKTLPNAAHRVIAAWEKKFPTLKLITQNVDGLHQQAGSKQVLSFHGNIWETICEKEQRVEVNHETPLKEIPPLCPYCQGLLRPNIVWFGEVIPDPVISTAQDWVKVCDFLLVAGTSGVVHPAAGFVYAAKQNGASIAEINPEETPLTSLADFVLRGKAAEMFTRIDDAFSTDH